MLWRHREFVGAGSLEPGRRFKEIGDGEPSQPRRDAAEHRFGKDA